MRLNLWFGFSIFSIREKIAMSSLQGLPPLPRSLSGFNLNEGGRREGEPPPPPPARSSSKIPKGGKILMQSSSRPSPPGRQLTTLDTQLAILRKEMVLFFSSIQNTHTYFFFSTTLFSPNFLLLKYDYESF